MKQRSRDVMFWPGMSTDIQEKADRCALCRKLKPRNQGLQIPKILKLPWQTVGIDFFCHEGKEYEVIVDFSFHFEIIYA